ncbi:hypothetical protein ACLOJK_008306 [Asimina triloba]
MVLRNHHGRRQPWLPQSLIIDVAARIATIALKTTHRWGAPRRTIRTAHHAGDVEPILDLSRSQADVNHSSHLRQARLLPHPTVVFIPRRLLHRRHNNVAVCPIRTIDQVDDVISHLNPVTSTPPTAARRCLLSHATMPPPAALPAYTARCRPCRPPLLFHHDQKPRFTRSDVGSNVGMSAWVWHDHSSPHRRPTEAALMGATIATVPS